MMDAFTDRKSARKVKDLSVKCTSTGCPWVNELRLLADHLEVCGYVLAPCANGCGDHMIRENLPLHNKVCALTYTSLRHATEDHKANSYGHHLDLAMVKLITQEKRIHMTVVRMPHFNRLKVNNKTYISGFILITVAIRHTSM